MTAATREFTAVFDLDRVPSELADGRRPGRTVCVGNAPTGGGVTKRRRRLPSPPDRRNPIIWAPLQNASRPDRSLNSRNVSTKRRSGSLLSASRRTSPPSPGPWSRSAFSNASLCRERGPVPQVRLKGRPASVRILRSEIPRPRRRVHRARRRGRRQDPPQSRRLSDRLPGRSPRQPPSVQVRAVLPHRDGRLGRHRVSRASTGPVARSAARATDRTVNIRRLECARVVSEALLGLHVFPHRESPLQFPVVIKSIDPRSLLVGHAATVALVERLMSLPRLPLRHGGSVSRPRW